MRIAVEGCCHDELEIIYGVLEHIQHLENTKIDLLLMCGDFEATRNPDDLACMAVPAKYRDMKYFYKYYKGEKKAPILTIVIGGNHEASNYMQELPYGGWLAPNIYYLGYAGIINVGGLRIGGISGIYKECDYHKGHFEKPPYTESAMRSCNHTRSLEVFRLKQVYKDVDIMLSHDWPLQAVYAGDVEYLRSFKPHFKEPIMQKTLGSPAAQEVLTHLKPKYWFSAHLHCKYPAVIKHRGEGENKITKFLALDKCLPMKDFLQVLDLPSSMEPPYKIQLDAEWLVILKNTNHLLNLNDSVRCMPRVGGEERYDFKVTDAEITRLLENFGGDLTLPENFQFTAQPYDGTSDIRNGRQPMCRVNPQTTLLCQMLGITDPFAVFCGQSNEENITRGCYMQIRCEGLFYSLLLNIACCWVFVNCPNSTSLG
ncbi:DBR1 [Bugula neritina]|uniref:DBR1 n=1 Tax=Bugula neritina TaxID=10212 RepID=A0A7J7K2N9_BUGNE|nr:DBR1 [Bugula neritina]